MTDTKELRVHLPIELHQKLQEEAKANRRSLSGESVYRLEQSLGARTG